MPWFDERKRRRVAQRPGNKFRGEFVVYAGLVDMEHLGGRLSVLLGVEEPDRDRDRPTEPAAVVGLQVDTQGVVTCQPGLSALPWAVARIKQDGGEKIDFNGYAGDDGFEKVTIRGISELLATRQLPAEPVTERTSAQTADGSNAAEQPERLPTTWDDIDAAVARALQAAGCPEEFMLKEYVRVQAIRVSLNRLLKYCFEDAWQKSWTA